MAAELVSTMPLQEDKLKIWLKKLKLLFWFIEPFLTWVTNHINMGIIYFKSFELIFI